MIQAKFWSDLIISIDNNTGTLKWDLGEKLPIGYCDESDLSHPKTHTWGPYACLKYEKIIVHFDINSRILINIFPVAVGATEAWFGGRSIYLFNVHYIYTAARRTINSVHGGPIDLLTKHTILRISIIFAWKPRQISWQGNYAYTASRFAFWKHTVM